jgi:hypothetical protein
VTSTDGTTVTPTRRAALLGGLLYLSTHVTSVAALLAYGDVLTDPTSAVSGEHDSAVLVGVVLDTLLALGVLGTGVALLPVLRPYAPIGAHAFSALRTMESAVIAVGVLPMVALVSLRDNASATLLVGLHQASFLVGQGLVISITTLVIAGTLWRTRLVPAWIGALGLVGGVAVLASNAAQLFGGLERGGSLAALLAAPVFAFEISFAVYLVVRGVRVPATGPVATPVYA